MKHLLDVLPKITQYESIPYAADLICQDCGESGFDCRQANMHKPNLVGWCETHYGFMGVYECPDCGARFRFHGGDPVDTKEVFEDKLPFYFGMECANWDEIEKQLRS